MAKVFLHIPKEVYQLVHEQLLPYPFDSEEAGFMFVKHKTKRDMEIFEFVEWYLVPPNGYLSRSYYHFELTDEARATVIKRAHDLGTSIVEFHSHDGNWPAAFSPTDLSGFQEFVPHVWWRLKHNPYLALVLTHSSFDGLAWLTDPQYPQYVDGVIVDSSTKLPTKLSPLRWDPNG